MISDMSREEKSAPVGITLVGSTETPAPDFNGLERASLDHKDAALASIAISLKRIADVLEAKK